MKRLSLDDDIIRLLLVSLSLVIIYLFIITPLGLSSSAGNIFQDIIQRYSKNIFYSDYKDSDIAIVSLDDKSLRKAELKWPWHRARFGQLISEIRKYDPAIIALDISFVGKSTYGTDDDEALAESIKNAGNVVLASYIGTDAAYVSPLAEIADDAFAIGFVNKIKDRSSVVRKARAVALDDGKIDYSFDIKAASLYEGIPVSDIKLSNRKVLLKEKSITLDADGTYTIKYKGGMEGNTLFLQQDLSVA
jgi:CHASE2 domain-containing sensor protein